MKTLEFTVESGMGDRIGALLTGRTLAAELGRELIYYWPVTYQCNAHFTDLLRMDSPIVTEVDPWPNETTLDFGARKYPEMLSSLQPIFNEIIKVRGYGRKYNQEDFGTVVRFSDQVLELASKYNATYFQEHMVGVHVRGVDYRYKTPDIKDYIAMVKKAMESLPDATLFICSDEVQTILALQVAFSGRTLTYPVRSFARDDPIGMIDAAVCLCLLRHCQSLVLSGYSMFSRLACKRQFIEPKEDLVLIENNT